MEQTIFATPSGHQVTIKPYLTFPEKRRVQRVFFSAARVDAVTGDKVIDMGAQIDATDTILKILVKRIQLANGRVIEGSEAEIFNALSDFSDPDIVALYDKIDDLTKTLDIFPNPERGEKDSA